MITKEDQNARGSCIFNPHIYQKSSNADDVCELQSTKLATAIFLLSPATAINPTFQGLLIISFNLVIFFWYVSDKSKFIQLETQHAGKFMTTVTCAHDLNFILIFHFLQYFFFFQAHL